MKTAVLLRHQDCILLLKIGIQIYPTCKASFLFVSIHTQCISILASLRILFLIKTPQYRVLITCTLLYSQTFQLFRLQSIMSSIINLFIVSSLPISSRHTLCPSGIQWECIKGKCHSRIEQLINEMLEPESMQNSIDFSLGGQRYALVFVNAL